jgi:L-alanine-DL-glutamate epimerase-like enolase superfamily enzyme
LKIAPHTGFSCGVAHLASLHLAAATPQLARFEYMFIENPLRDIFVEDFPAPKAGFIALPTGPGLGLALDPAKLERYRLN